jgi:hypothetical protein
MAEDYISMFDRGESKDDLELSYHCSSATHSEGEEEEEVDLDTLQMGVPLNTGNLALVLRWFDKKIMTFSYACIG